MKGKSYAILLSILVLAFIFYGSTINNEFALDDNIVISQNENVKKGISGIPAIFSELYLSNSEQNYGYRPITLTTFALEYHFLGENPHFNHFINVLIYALSCMLFYLILIKLLGESYLYLILISTLVFIVHPIHTEVVNNIKSRDELLALFFSLTAFYSFIRYNENHLKRYFTLGVFLFVLAVFSKLTAIVFVAIIPLGLYYFKSMPIKKIAAIVSSFILVYVIFYLAKNIFVGSEGLSRTFEFYENPLFYSEFSDRIPASAYIALYYLKLLVYPATLISYYGYNTVEIMGWDSPLVYLSILIFGAAIFFAFKDLKKKTILSFSVFATLIALFPFVNLHTPVVGIVAERFLYPATFGFSILIAAVLFKILDVKEGRFTRRQRITGLVFSFLIAVSSFAIVKQRNSEWASYRTLYSSDVEKAENSFNLNMLYANYLLENMNQSQDVISDAKQAKELYRKAIDIYPDYAKPYVNLSTLYLGYFSNYEIAEKLLHKSLKVDPNFYKSYINLAKLEHVKGNYAEVDNYFMDALVISGESLDVYIELINYKLKTNNLVDAAHFIDKALVKYPESTSLLLLCGDVNMKRGKVSEAVNCYESYLGFKPGDKVVLEALNNFK